MFARLSGEIVDIAGATATIDVQGVGYEVHCTARCRERLQVGSKAVVTVFTAVREDEIKLYGFDDPTEKEVFLLLLRVSGIGAKTASEILSQVDKVELLRYIGAGDLTKLQSMKGVGKKTAERIVVELKDKVASYALERTPQTFQRNASGTDQEGEALLALQALGFQRREAEVALGKAQADNLSAASTADLVRSALRYL
jgi:Holliday junction DNA helicase RuvA